MKMNWKFLIAIVGSVFIYERTSGSPEPTTTAWDQWRPLVGEWQGAGKGSPGEGAGGFSFAFDLQNKVLVRKSHTDYPPAEGRPAFSHDDLMVVYSDEVAHKFRADYFDNEGHVIRYTAGFSPGGQTLTFISDPTPSQPSFRLTYVKNPDDTLGIKFEIAPPNAPDKFKMYVEGSAHKR
jgi:catechol 2,3-dioxygenase-like lactoylglutathione lyase family enzyme